MLSLTDMRAIQEPTITTIIINIVIDVGVVIVVIGVGVVISIISIGIIVIIIETIWCTGHIAWDHPKT